MNAIVIPNECFKTKSNSSEMFNKESYFNYEISLCVPLLFVTDCTVRSNSSNTHFAQNIGEISAPMKFRYTWDESDANPWIQSLIKLVKSKIGVIRYVIQLFKY